ncbi:type II toxin-antitoxin system HicA family toxin [Lactobacillus kefiranofaciens]|uniref:HicA toxin of toxin-antitoxin n=1 Tax=Lactobacillus kefiranofaciens TaxID=267818 RepID=A0AAX3UGM5_9LACO|nr:type II toxin-antitoxin system HicA family toxin [Lactobacillus kefiranofaciens]AEG39966.1 Hypothetical protein WANG_0271 [Lactobacillus kefiranofaciens subsp. kefiranofaciens]KRL29682.1 hypothetical protein FC94_GL001995 [Lactobacillus kefiranofaciens subsp. kefirgranum DSM 10550 = JCM 8572]KRM21489.1 hypothetical protein FC93_GL000601 [Lactobacillus kefiranofaciens subsp. kefiranofaciens DSM 5016 = JCM 6985]MCJ2172451.1 type II toxin-antitoxin system HicA family toxin [Lactobacillus kefira
MKIKRKRGEVFLNQMKKLIKKFEQNPGDFTYDEAIRLMRYAGFKLLNKGRTSGSRVQFERGDVKINLHKPHPQNTLKQYQLKK